MLVLYSIYRLWSIVSGISNPILIFFAQIMELPAEVLQITFGFKTQKEAGKTELFPASGVFLNV
ncbi:hypothetical protein, partial [Limosilactobacillus fermentum]|uniref:hypothetical protein n=1 Tax=Limosilactobacillus fermentum TaxID=1613 RepID=UPI003F113E49